MAQVHSKLIEEITPLLQHSCHVLAYLHHIDACLMFLLYRHRRRDSKVDDGKDEKDSRHYAVSTHLC